MSTARLLNTSSYLVSHGLCSPINVISTAFLFRRLPRLWYNYFSSSSSNTPKCSLKPSSFSTHRPLSALKVLQCRRGKYLAPGIIDLRPFHTFGRRLTDPASEKNSQPAIPTDSSTLPLDEYSLDELHDLALNIDSENSTTFNKIYDIVEHLISVRKEKPNSLHYAALIRANASAFQGSAETVRQLLSEMDDLGIPKDSRIYHNALLALAIHPDYIIRMQIMSEMKKLWLRLSPEGWHHLVIGLVRDRQYEMAMESLEKMMEDQIDIKPWLLDIIMYQLCESEEYEEALAMLKHRWDHKRNEIHSEIWHFMLDSFAKGLYYEGLKFIWRHQIQSKYLIPSDGILSAVLNTAARYADPHLATSAAKILSERSSVEPYHYEALMEAYAKSQDLKSAFRVISVMAKAGLSPDSSNTRPLMAYLSSDPQLPIRAWEVLSQFHSNEQLIPIATINVILESCVAQLNIDLAMIFYKKINTLSVRPNTATFNHILQGLSKTTVPSKSEAMFLASEMRSLDIKPDDLTYDRLILICLREKNYEDAFRYMKEMIQEGQGKNEGKGWWLRRGTAQKCVLTTLVEGDSRGWEILSAMEQRGMKVNKLKEWAKLNWKSKVGGMTRLTKGKVNANANQTLLEI